MRVELERVENVNGLVAERAFALAGEEVVVGAGVVGIGVGDIHEGQVVRRDEGIAAIRIAEQRARIQVEGLA